MRAPRVSRQNVLDGIYGLLVGDACGVPYESRRPEELPPRHELEMYPPYGHLRTYAHVPPGTWSDDGAQALCLLDSFLFCGQYHPMDFASRLLRWHDGGYMAVDDYVFDVGIQTSAAIRRLRQGIPTANSGLKGERNNGNGSLMRCLPLALLHSGNDLALVIDAHRQSRLTHGHPRSQVSCALYCLWARRTLQRATDPWASAIETLRHCYLNEPVSRRELEEHIRPDEPAHGEGSGYVVDSLNSARLACQESNYKAVIQAAIALGQDTDTTAAIAGGIAGLRYGREGIPMEWLQALRGKDILNRVEVSIRLQYTDTEDGYSNVQMTYEKNLQSTVV